MRRPLCLGLCLALALATLTSCAGNSVPITEDVAPAYTLPPARMPYVAPIGDATLEYTADATMHFPSRDGMTLTTVTTPVACSASRPHAESILRTALTFTGDGLAGPLFGGVDVQLAGVNPVEVSRNVATVNLSAPALQLDRRAFYIACQAIANTLTELDEIQYVNVLVADRQVGLDIASTLPTGAFQRTLSRNAGALYEQAIAQRTEAGAAARLTSVAALYFPLGSKPGLMSEARSVAFADQSPETMSRALIAALGESESGAAMPELGDLLLEEPYVSEAADTGLRVLELRFSEDLDIALTQAGLTRTDAMASLVYTLCSYLPNLSGVRVWVGEELLEALPVEGAEELRFTDGMQRRADYAALLMDRSTLYFADAEGHGLVRVERPVPYYLANSPRQLILLLAQGPRSADSARGQALLPADGLRDADILGISLQEGTLLVNFSAAFEQAVSAMDAERERLFVYALTNTLLRNPAIHRAAYFVAGAQPERLAGEIAWAGFFYPNPGLASDN